MYGPIRLQERVFAVEGYRASWYSTIRYGVRYDDLVAILIVERRMATDIRSSDLLVATQPKLLLFYNDSLISLGYSKFYLDKLAGVRCLNLTVASR